MRHLSYIALATVLLVCPSLAAPVDYFPPGTLDETPQSSQFKEHWYSQQLNGLKEPSLWELSKTQNSQTYRFLWLRSFHHPISVRLDVNPSGTSTLITKEIDGQGGYEPGKLIINKARVLTSEDTEWILDRIREVGFWDLPTYENPYTAGPNGEKVGTVNLNGAQWIVEGVKDGKYKVVDRWSPENGPVRILGIFLLIDIAKLKLLY